MPIYLDHLIVPSRDRVGAARLLAQLLGVAWSEQGAVGPFSPVYVNDGLTLDFDQWTEPFPKQHYCFRVGPEEFGAILERIKAAGLAYRSLPHGADDCQVNPAFGGSLIYWSEPDGHVWELLTVSYERQSPPLASSNDRISGAQRKSRPSQATLKKSRKDFFNSLQRGKAPPLF